MKNFAALLFLLLASCAREEAPPVPEGPVAWSVSASVDKKEVQVGEDLVLTLVVRHPEDGRYVPPPDASFAPFEVIARTEEKPGPTETRLQFRLAAYRLPGDAEIPALQVSYQESDKIQTLATERIPVKIVTSLTPDVTDIHDIKEPVDLMVPRDLRLLAWLLLALLAALAAYLIYRKLRKEPGLVEAPIVAPPLPAPDVEAEAALRRLVEKGLLEKGELAAFYTELAEIVKRYVGRRFEIPYLERTTSEMLSDLRPKKLATGTTSELRGILDASDLVKFAKYLPEPAHAEGTMALARSWIQKTRPSPEPSKAVA
jgi:hypothetical protein